MGSEGEIPDGDEFHEVRLDPEGLSGLLRSGDRHPVEEMTGEFHHLKLRPEYPKGVNDEVRWGVLPPEAAAGVSQHCRGGGYRPVGFR